MAVAAASQMSLILEEDTGFDYLAGGFSGDVIARARNVAMGIRRKGTDIHRMILEIGQGLLWAKEALGHGFFLSWLDAETGMSSKTAQRYMQVAENLDPKFVTLTNLPSNVLYSLAAPSTPAPLREQIVRRTIAGERPEPKMVLEQIAASKAALPGKRPLAKVVTLASARLIEGEIVRNQADHLLDELESRLGGEFAAFLRRFKAIEASELAEALSRR